MACIDNYNYEILLKGSFRECSEYIKKNFKSIRNLDAGEEVIEGVMLIGKPPIPVAYDDQFVYFPYTKPCHGSYVLKVPLKEYMESEAKKEEDRKKKEIEKDKGYKKENILSKLKFW